MGAQDSGPLPRLVDDSANQSDGGPRWSRAVELVRSLDPFELSAARKQRLLMSLGQGSIRRRRWALRPVVVAALVIGSGAAASAALTAWPASLLRSCKTLVSGTAEPVRAARPRGSRPVVVMPRAAEDQAREQPAPAIPPAPSRQPDSARRPRAEARAHRPPVAAGAEDPSLLIRAARALRIDGDPRLARALATRYLDEHPRGALAEEALAISIEAAVDHRDADAALLGARYLAQFPRGSFRALAERTRASADRP